MSWAWAWQLCVPFWQCEGQGTVAGLSEKQKWKSPVKRGTCFIGHKKNRVHWFLSSIGWQWNLGTKQLCCFSSRSDSSGGAALASYARCWLWCIGIPCAFGPWYLRDYFPLPTTCSHGEGHHLHRAPLHSVSGQQWLAVITEGPSTLEFASLPGLTELTSANLQDTASSSFFSSCPLF